MQDEADRRAMPHRDPGPRARRAAADARQYDSFVVRVWRHPGNERLIRADVRHVQTGEYDSAMECDPGWIQDVLDRRLRAHEAIEQESTN